MINIKNITILYKNKTSIDEQDIEASDNLKVLKQLLNHAYENNLQVAFVSYNYPSFNDVIKISPFFLKYKQYFESSYIRYTLKSPVSNISRDVCFFEVSDHSSNPLNETGYISLNDLAHYYQLPKKEDVSDQSGNAQDYVLFNVLSIIRHDSVKIKNMYFSKDYINRKPLGKPDFDMLDEMAVANYIIKVANKNLLPLTHLKLQKILFYLQEDFINEFGYPLINGSFRFGQYGPYLDDVYYNLNQYGATNLDSPVKVLNTDLFTMTTPEISEDFKYIKKLYSDVLLLLTYKTNYLVKSSVNGIKFDDL